MNTQEKYISHGSLFSGIGGFDLAAEWIGWENIFHCEINEFCTKILNYHFPNAEHYADITKTDFTKWRGKIDVLTGGFPCQPFSVAGSRKGTDDNRYLCPEMLRAIQEIRPTWIVGENVGGIITMVQPGKTLELGCSTSLFGEDYEDEEMHQQFVVETVCTDLEREGYSVQPILVPACAIGAPHRRDRVWFIANCTDTGVEAMQCRRKDRISTVGAITNTESQQSERYRPEQSTNGQRNKGNLEEAIAKIIQNTPCEDGKISQLNPLFVEEMMGFPLMWTTLPYLLHNGEKSQSKPTVTP